MIKAGYDGHDRDTSASGPTVVPTISHATLTRRSQSVLRKPGRYRSRPSASPNRNQNCCPDSAHKRDAGKSGIHL